jgi:signal transduction histidine kinase
MSPEERRRFSQNIVSDAARLNGLVRHLLELARAEAAVSGEGSTSVAEALDLVKPPPDLHVSAEGADLRCRISAENLAIILGNLADNSAQHSARTMAVTASEHERQVSIRVADDGSGIDPGNRDRLFDPFFTTRRESGGTGMGLSIVAALVKVNGGTIRVLEAEHGAAFEIRLPAS